MASDAPSFRRGVCAVPVDDLRPSGYPDLLARGDMREGVREIFGAIGMADQEWMQADGHHPSCLGAVLVEYIELILDHASECFRTLLAVEDRRDVVDLHR